jgi:hypothetical protein
MERITSTANFAAPACCIRLFCNVGASAAMQQSAKKQYDGTGASRQDQAKTRTHRGREASDVEVAHIARLRP